MTTTLLLILAWVAGISALLKLRFIRRRPDAWPLVALWPVMAAYVVVIFAYEGLCCAWRALRS